MDFLATNFNAYELELINSKGQLVFEKKQVNQNESIQLNAFPDGVYWLSLRNENHTVTRKVVKVR